MAYKRNSKEPTVLSCRKLLCIAGMGWTFDAMDVGFRLLLTALKEDWGLTAAIRLILAVLIYRYGSRRFCLFAALWPIEKVVNRYFILTLPSHLAFVAA